VLQFERCYWSVLTREWTGALLGSSEAARLRLNALSGTGMYFWGTLAVVFFLTCAMGWKLDRKRKGGVSGRATGAMDAHANEARLHSHHNVDGPFGGY
jgi:hypothetical protein